MGQQEPSKEFIDVDITIHVFTASATLVGVCITVISLLMISRHLSHVKSFGEKLLAFDAILFLTSCILSYSALRRRRRGNYQRLEKSAEEIFFFALAFMSLICIFIVFELV
jgi:hypothetical protein